MDHLPEESRRGREIHRSKSLAREIDERAKTDPRVRLLCEIKGIGRYNAMLVIAEMGELESVRSARIG